MSKMITCKACGKEIASNAKNCPGYGAKNKKPFYKRWWFILLAIGSMGSSSSEEVANTETAAKTDETNTEASKPKEEVKETYAVGEEVVLNDNKLIVNSVETSSGTDFDKPQDGNELVIVNVTITNDGEKEITYNPYDFEMLNSQGQITNQAFTIVNTNTALNSGKLAAGGTVTGTIAFEQPAGDTGLVLKYKANMFSNKEEKVKIN